MKYIQVFVSNGFCGCNEEYLLEEPDNVDDKWIMSDIFDTYSYESGAAGINPDDEEFEEYSYEDCIIDNTSWEEISKEEFERLRDEEDWEVR